MAAASRPSPWENVRFQFGRVASTECVASLSTAVGVRKRMRLNPLLPLRQPNDSEGLTDCHSAVTLEIGMAASPGTNSLNRST